MHRDIKSGNVLLSEDLQSAKICDVGLARIMGGSTLASSSHNVHATFAYAAPEDLFGDRFALLLMHVPQACVTRCISRLQCLCKCVRS